MILGAIRRRWAYRAARTRLTSGSLAEAWAHVRYLWSKADTVYKAPVGYGGMLMPEYDTMLRVADFGLVRAAPFLHEGLRDDNPSVVAYSVETLHMLGAPVDRCMISPAVLAMRVRWSAGNFGSTVAVEDFLLPAQSSVAPDGSASVAPPGAPSSAPRVNAGIGPAPESDDGDDKDGQ